jgi:hypothetical protein
MLTWIIYSFLGVKEGGSDSVCPMDTGGRAGIYGLLDTLFRSTFGQDHFRLSLVFVHLEHFRAKVYATLATETFFFIYNYFHRFSFFLFIIRFLSIKKLLVASGI